MAQTPGWFPDPYGRFQQRYHDGESWTAHVADGGAQQVDPMGTSTVVPFAQPQHTLPGASTATSAATSTGTSTGTTPSGGGAQATTSPGTATTSGSGAALSRFLDSLGPHAREREAPSLHTALAGAGGAIVAVGLVIAVVRGDDARGLAAVAAIVLIVVGLLLRVRMAGQRELRSAAVGIGVIGIATIGLAIVGDNVDGASGYAVIGLLYLAAWALPGFRGCPIMLGLGALALVAALGSATSSGGSQRVGSVDVGSVGTGQGVAFLVAAAVLLGLVYVLDSAGFHGVATSLVVAALISAAAGAAATVSKLDGTEATVLILFVGLVVCIVGSHGERRATTWYGAAIASVGLVAFLASAIKPTTQGQIATVGVVAGVILVAVPLVLSMMKANRPAPSAPRFAPTADAAASAGQ